MQLPVAKLGNFDLNTLIRGAAEFFGETDDGRPWDHPHVMRRFTDLDMAGVAGLEKANAFIEHLHSIVARDRAAAEARSRLEADPVHIAERELAQREGKASEIRSELRHAQGALGQQCELVADLEGRRNARAADRASWLAITRGDLEPARIELERLETLIRLKLTEFEGAVEMVQSARVDLENARRAQPEIVTKAEA